MQARLNRLRETEENLDRLCKAMKMNYQQSRRSPSNEFFAYVTRDDLLDVFGEDSVILTVRNCDTIRKGKAKDEDDSEKHTLRVHGRWKKVDVRLVTTDGEITARNTQTRTSEQPAETTDGDESSETSRKIASSQPEPAKNSNGARRPGRRRKPERLELRKDDDDDGESSVEIEQVKRFKSSALTEEEKELEERRITAETLLGYRPPLVQRKRNFEEDWLECRYNNFLPIQQRKSTIF